MLNVDEHELDNLLLRGWRRFGPAYFKPACFGCDGCVPLRVPVETFQPSKQQKRVLKRGGRFRVEVRSNPSVDMSRLDLYDRWHRSQENLRGWPQDRIDAEEYYHQFAFPHPCVREFAYYDTESDVRGGHRLVGVAIVDETPTALSAIYTYHDPDYRSFSLGTLSILFQIDYARRQQKDFVYLGYRVNGCSSSEYKGRFQPHELLSEWPEFGEQPVWVFHAGRWEKAEPGKVLGGSGCGNPNKNEALPILV